MSPKLEAAENYREAGKIIESLDSLISVVNESSEFLDFSVPEDSDSEGDEEEEYYVQELIRLRAVASYQAGLSSHQIGEHQQGDDFLYKLGFNLRLADQVRSD